MHIKENLTNRTSTTWKDDEEEEVCISSNDVKDDYVK